jgi:hypothetical protein
MRRVLVLSILFAAALTTAAEARKLPGPTKFFGPNCHAIYRATGQPTLFVGTVLGGRTTAHRWGDGTMTDYRTFQGCFVTAEACAAWTASHAARYPRPPGYVRCTPVYIGLRP